MGSQGDSGGPLTANNEVVGIASWVVPCGKGYPDVYTNVYAYRSWIKSIIARAWSDVDYLFIYSTI